MMMLTEKQKEIAKDAFNTASVKLTTTERVYAAVEDVLASQPAAQPFSVTLEEARNVWRAVLRGLGGRAAQINPSDLQAAINAEFARRSPARPFSVTLKEAHDIRQGFLGETGDLAMQRVVNTILARRPAAQEALCVVCGNPVTYPAGSDVSECRHNIRFIGGEARLPKQQSPQEVPTAVPDSSCEYCGPICYGGAEHSERVENGDKWKPAQEAPAPSTQNVVLPPLKCRGDYLEARIAQLNEREEQLLSTLKKLAAVRPQIEDERDKQWEFGPVVR
jgi:hypothetical protein